jgi:hypothetical protein
VTHIGAEPPWRGVSRWYGEWRWVTPDARLWIEEPGYWQWYPPPQSWALYQMGRVLRNTYLPTIKAQLTNEVLFAELLSEAT